MVAEEQREFPNWEQMYEEGKVETLPWFNPDLDEDLAHTLDELGLRSGSALDLGTGPGTQAIQLARRGFSVTAIDISGAAIRLARQKAEEQGLDITWQQEDILDSRLDQPFDFIFDRGCFHTLAPERRPDYVRIVSGLVKPGGNLFLKCFSHLQPGEWGPYRFTPQQIRELFSRRLSVQSIHDTVFQGPQEERPRALFCVMRKGELATGDPLGHWDTIPGS